MAIILAVVDIYVLDFVINIGTSWILRRMTAIKNADFMLRQHNLPVAH
jgi:hypothetical protein